MSLSFNFGVRPDINYGTPGKASSTGGRPFDPVYKTEKHNKKTVKRLVSLKNCYVMWGRTYKAFGTAEVPSDATKSDSGAKTLYASIKHPDGDKRDPELTITTSGASDLEKTVFPLYQLHNGKITLDYRGMPFIPVYT